MYHSTGVFEKYDRPSLTRVIVVAVLVFSSVSLALSIARSCAPRSIYLRLGALVG